MKWADNQYGGLLRAGHSFQCRSIPDLPSGERDSSKAMPPAPKITSKGKEGGFLHNIKLTSEKVYIFEKKYQ